MENETQVFFYNPTWKMKLVSPGIDPDHFGFTADHVSAELFVELIIVKCSLCFTRATTRHNSNIRSITINQQEVVCL